MYTLCKTTHQATGVELSLYCNFFNKNEKSLLVTGANVIRVFRLVPDLPPRVIGRQDPHENDPPKVKLECMASFTLHDNIVAIASVSLSPLRDSILLAFKDAKLSIVEYDPHNHDLKTISLHYFEKEEIKGGFTSNPHIPIVRIDPERRCAAMLIYSRKIVILPFRSDLAKEDVDYASPLARRPILQSYIIDLKDFEAPNIDNVKDMQFLHGYYDPTLMLLHEPIKTFPGRLAVRPDTFCLAALSLNIRQRLHPVIWSVSGLPHDCISLLAVPKPIGGVLLFAVNSIAYLTQSVPAYGVSLNSMGDQNTNFPLRKQEGMLISLDNSCAQFLNEEQIVISVQGGELYVLTLLTDSMRSVRSFHFDKAASSVLTCCMTILEDQYLFLGSRLGNSLLLKYTEKEIAQENKKEKTPAPVQPSTKRKKLDTLGDWIASNVEDIEDHDILQVYGRQQEHISSIMEIISYSFEVMDSLLNIGPCGDVAMGEPVFLSEEYENSLDPCVEIVTTSGHGKNGALSILQRSIKPQVLTTFDLPGVLDMWTLVGKKSESRNESNRPDHSFLILSRQDSSLVLRTEEEISELEDSGFDTSTKTIFSGNMGSLKYIVQVTPKCVRLLESTTLLQSIAVEVPLVTATLADPYLVALSNKGGVYIFTLITSRSAAPKLVMANPPDHKRSRLQTICAYCDVSGLFTKDYPTEMPIKYKKIKSDAEIKKELDDEDEMLYGASSVSVFDPPKIFEPEAERRKKQENQWWKKWYKESRASYWLVGVRDSGDLEIYTLPDFRISYAVRNFWQGHRVLQDSMLVSPAGQIHYTAEQIPVIHEILLIGMGNKNLRPVLFARVNEDLLMYEGFSFSDGLEPDQLKIRFKLIEHNIIMRTKGFNKKKKDSMINDRKVDHANRFKYFTNIGVYSGVFICGPYPHWVLLTVRGEFRFHPMSVDGSVQCFSPFRNVNCQNGFLYFNRKESMRICLLPTILLYDAPWPVRKVPLRCSPHFILYHLETKTYCVVTSSSEPSLKIWKFNGDDKEEVQEERDERFIKVQVPVFSIQLFSPINWQMIPNTDYDLDRWEHVTCCKNVVLSYEGDRSGVRGYIAIGTTYCYGEDITCRGRILIFDVIDVVPEPGQPLTKNRLKLLYEGEQKGPVTAIAHCFGYLVSAIGQKIFIWQLKDGNLIGVAFIDTQIYVSKILILKNLLLVSDVCKSISLMRFQEKTRTLSLVSRDLKPLDAYGIQYMVDNNTLCFLASDADKNLVIYSYQPESRESAGGTKLIRKGDLKLGSHVDAFFRIRCRLGDVSGEGRAEAYAEKRHITMMASLDGSLGYIIPISERTYRRFSMVYNLLVQFLKHTAGLNPKTCRTFQSRHKLNINPSRGILDGQLIWSFIHLPAPEKAEIAKKVGANVDDIIEEIMEIDRLTAHF